MNSKNIIFMISLVLIAFVFFSVAASMLCQPSQNNAVVAAVSNALSAPQTLTNPPAPDPFSWEPVLRQLISFLSKACPR
jgi:hypothetical protein